MFATGRSDIGRIRTQNQDAIFVSTEPVGPLPNLFIVADGMGGHNAGDVASSQAVAIFCEYVRKAESIGEDGMLDLMVAAAVDANQRIYEQSMADASLAGMGTTFTACVVNDGKCVIVHIGDSRCYMITQQKIKQLTIDHSYVNEMVKAGHLTLSEAREHPKRNILTRVLGVSLEMAVDGHIRELEPECVLLLCSDGLTNMLPDEHLHTTAAAVAYASVDERADALIGMANARGGNDNISVILIDIKPFPTKAGE